MTATEGEIVTDPILQAWERVKKMQDAKGSQRGPWQPDSDARDADEECLQEIYDAISYLNNLWWPQFSALYRPGYFPPAMRDRWGEHAHYRRELMKRLKQDFAIIAKLGAEWQAMVKELEGLVEG